MTSFSTLLRGLRRPGRSGDLNKVVFVSYGTFDCNSAGHIAGFAGELAGAGLQVAVCARGPVDKAYAFGPPAFEFFSLKQLTADPKGVIGFDGPLDPARTLLVCWTPRKASRRALERAVARTGVGHIVHFEDNEDHLGALRAQAGGEDDRAEREQLVAGALGATIIEPRLRETLPAGLPTLVLEPGVDLEGLAAPLPPHRRATLLRAFGAPEDAAVIVYPGNVHRANAGEMAELYRAVGRLRDAGRRVVLIKTGKDDVGMAAVLGFAPAEAGVIEVGLVERSLLTQLVKCADLFVQPGAPGLFNDYRLPSKLPEFMAIGRPIILPRTNVGLRLRDGHDALLLEAGSAGEIAAKIENILDHPEVCAPMARNAQAFARRTYDWKRQGKKLLDFLRHLQGARG